MVLAGYFIGGLIETAFGIKLDEHIDKVVIVVVALSLIPMIYEYFKSRRERKNNEAELVSESEM